MKKEECLKKWNEELARITEGIKRAGENESISMIELLYPKMEQVTEFIRDLNDVDVESKDSNCNKAPVSVSLPHDNILRQMIRELSNYGECIDQYEYGLPDHNDEYINDMIEICKECLRQ